MKYDGTKNKKSSGSYTDFEASLKSGKIGNLYIFYGDERYLLERSLESLRAIICTDGLDSFNYKRFEGKTLSTEALEDAVNTLPAFADRTMIEIHDYDIFKGDQRVQLCELFSDLPEYVCIVFIYSTIEYKPDGRYKINKDILKYACAVEFVPPDQDRLIKWIQRHFHDAGKKISQSNAEHIAAITRGLMTTLNGEIEKAAAYAKTEYVTRKDIDTVVTPVLEAVAFNLSDALVSRDNAGALRLLDELFQMREEPHKLIYIISLKMRQILAARVFIEKNLGKSEFIRMCGLRHEYQAQILFNTARKTNLADCRDAVLLCSACALELNNAAEPESRLIELVTKLAFRD